MNSARIKLLLTGLILIGLSIGFYFYQQSSEAEKKIIIEAKQVQTFNKTLIPLFQEKAKIIQKFFPDAKSQDDMKPILDLIMKWDAKSVMDIKDMVEIGGFLDQLLSKAMISLDEKEKRLLLREIEKIERKIRELDPQFRGRMPKFKDNEGTGMAGVNIPVQLSGPQGLAFDDEGNLYISEFYGNTIRKVKAWSCN